MAQYPAPGEFGWGAKLKTYVDDVKASTQDAIARVDPGEAGTVGQAIRHGPDGPDWGGRVISADWYSDLNDAIAVAGPGGTVRLSHDTTYDVPDALRVVEGLVIEGEDRNTSIINVTGEAGIASADPTTNTEYVTIRNLSLVGNGVGGSAIDLRGISNSTIDQVYTDGFTDHTVRIGGSGSSGGWLNNIWRSRLRAPMVGAALYLEGRTSPTGAAIANGTTVIGCSIPSRSAVTSVSVDIEHGESNLITGCDMGYGVDSLAAVRIGSLGNRNRLLSVRTENVKRAILIEGGQNNTIEASSFGLFANTEYHGAEIYAGSLRNRFVGNWWDNKGLGPRVWEDAGPGAYQTLIDDISPVFGELYGNTATDPRGRIHTVNSAGALAFGVKTNADVSARFYVTGGGWLQWRNGETGTYLTGLSVASDGAVSWDDGTRVRVTKRASLPAASEAYRGVMFRIEGAAGVADAVYICVKDDADAYSWKQVTLA